MKIKKCLSTLMVMITIVTCSLFVGCSGKNNNKQPEQDPPAEHYDITNIEKALQFSDYEDVAFSTKFATIWISTDSGIIGFFDMQGNMEQVSTGELDSDDFDAIKISHEDFWNSTIRRVRVTYYKYIDYIVDESHSQKFLEAQGYVICSTDVVKYSLK